MLHLESAICVSFSSNVNRVLSANKWIIVTPLAELTKYNTSAGPKEKHKKRSG